MTRNDVVKAVAITAQIFGREFTEDAAEVFVSDLAGYPSAQVVEALARCRRELPRFPSVAEIIARIPDGRPGPEEAWTMVPKDEDDTAVMTTEMAEALRYVRSTMSWDMVAARMAFREKYASLVADARAKRVPASWSVSLGLSAAGRTTALSHAVERGYIGADQAQALLPDFRPRVAPEKQIEGPADPGARIVEGAECASRISEILNHILSDSSPEERTRIAIARQAERAGKPMTEEELFERRRELAAQAEKLREGRA